MGEKAPGVGDRVEALRCIRAEAAIVSKGTLGTIQEVDDPQEGEDPQVIKWDGGPPRYLNSVGVVSKHIKVVAKGPRSQGLRKKYDDNQLAPEVMTELAGIWDRPSTAEPAPRKR